MSASPIKSAARDLQPAFQLWKMYHPENARYAFRAENLSQARQWQNRTRAALGRRIGLGAIPRAAVVARRVERVMRRGYLREKILLRTGPHTLMPVYLLLPHPAPRRLPVVLAFHGHGYGVKDIVGLWEDGTERDIAEGYQQDFAVALCRAGFAVAAPEISCFGERQTDFSYLNTSAGQGIPSTCMHTAMLAFTSAFPSWGCVCTTHSGSWTI